MRRTWLLLPVAVLVAGCGGSLDHDGTQQKPAAADLSAYGISANLPDGWSGRIVLGASGRPVLHAASFPLPSNDEDSGEVARESMGIRGMYLNVRDLGAGDGGTGSPLTFSADDFGPPPPGPGSMCCRILEASRKVAVAGEQYRITAVSGGDERPSDSELEPLDSILRTLSLEATEPPPVPALPADAQQIGGHGISMRLPDGWNGSVRRGTLTAESAGGALRLRLLEHGGSDAAFVTGRLPLRLTPAEFVAPGPGNGPDAAPAITGSSFVDAGRDFLLTVEADSLPPDPDLVEQANEALATLKVEPGDFYEGTVEPATFAAADGWHTGDTGPAQIQPDGEQTMSWASTIPYRDSGFQFPPHETQEALPPDGIAIVVMLSQSGPRSNGPGTTPPLKLGDAFEGNFEGMDPTKATRQLSVHAHNYDAQVWVLFGREHPTQEQLDRAQAELDRLQLPDWPPF